MVVARKFHVTRTDAVVLTQLATSFRHLGAHVLVRSIRVFVVEIFTFLEVISGSVYVWFVVAVERKLHVATTVAEKLNQHGWLTDPPRCYNFDFLGIALSLTSGCYAKV